MKRLLESKPMIKLNYKIIELFGAQKLKDRDTFVKKLVFIYKFTKEHVGLLL